MPQPAEHSTPWCVVCPNHGHVALTEREWGAQVADVERDWFCPRCTAIGAVCDAGAVLSAQEDTATEDAEPPEPPRINVMHCYDVGKTRILLVSGHDDDDWTVRTQDGEELGRGFDQTSALVAAVAALVNSITAVKTAIIAIGERHAAET